MKCKSFDSKWYTHFSQQSMQGKINNTCLLESSQAYMAGIRVTLSYADGSYTGGSILFLFAISSSHPHPPIYVSLTCHIEGFLTFMICKINHKRM